MTKPKQTSLLILVAIIVLATLYWFKPGGIEGPRVTPEPTQGKGFDHSPFAAVLKQALKPDGTIDYGALKKNQAPLNRYLGLLAATGPTSAPHRFRTTESKLAYYLNAYNAFVLAAIRDHCPLKSVQDAYIADGFFWRISFVMSGKEITLSDLQATYMSPAMRGNPAAHFARVGGAKGFLPLAPKPYTAETLKTDLDALAKRAIASKRMVQKKDKSLKLSSLFLWHKNEFRDPMRWIRTIDPHLASGRSGVSYMPFDWSLNGTCD